MYDRNTMKEIPQMASEEEATRSRFTTGSAFFPEGYSGVSRLPTGEFDKEKACVVHDRPFVQADMRQEQQSRIHLESWYDSKWSVHGRFLKRPRDVLFYTLGSTTF